MPKKAGRIKLPFPELLYPYSPVAKPMPIPPVADACEGDLVTVSFSCTLIPYLLGLLEIYRYQDSFVGTLAEKQTAVGVMRQLMEILGMAECGNVLVPAFRLSEDCILEYSGDSITWLPVAGWSAIAPVCFTGAPGAPGAPGAAGSDGAPGAAGIDGSDGSDGAPGAPGAAGSDGAPGADGAPGDCSDCGDPGEAEQDEENWSEQACAIADGVAVYLQSGFLNACEAVQSGLLAAKTIADIIQEYVDLAPVLGDTVAAVMQFAENIANKDINDIIGFTNGDDFKDLIQCEIYCILNADTTGTVNQALMNAATDQVIFWADDIVPGLPYITLYGQAFALFVSAADRQKILKTALIHSGERSSVCAAQCLDCDDPEPETCECETFAFNGAFIQVLPERAGVEYTGSGHAYPGSGNYLNLPNGAGIKFVFDNLCINGFVLNIGKYGASSEIDIIYNGSLIEYDTLATLAADGTIVTRYAINRPTPTAVTSIEIMSRAVSGGAIRLREIELSVCTE